jgi:hypothetical protein
LRGARSRLREALTPLDAAALGLAVALTAAFWLPRLPPGLGGIVPRRAGFGLLSALIDGAQTRAGRAGAMAAAYALLLVCAGVLAARVRAHWRRFAPGLAAVGWMERAARLVCLLAGFYLLARGARFGLAAALDILQNAFYAPESMRLAEPLWTALAFAWFCVVFLRAAAALVEWTLSAGPLALELARDWIGWAAALIVPGVALFLWSYAAFDAGKPSLAAAAGLPPAPSGARRLAILTQERGRAAQQPFLLDLGRPGETDYGSARLEAVERYLGAGRSVYERPALRFLYSGRTFEMDPDGLRRALERGVALGDPLARTLLLDNLGCAPAGAATRARLDALADEGRFHVGPAAAERLSAAYARQGDADGARRWRLRVQEIPGAPVAGLLGAVADDAVVPGGAITGTIAGTIAGLRGARVGLYCRLDEYAPYALGPAQLVAAADLGADGRFRFSDLPSGAYFLAVARDVAARPKTPLSLLGHRGDLVLTRRRPIVKVSLRAR